MENEPVHISEPVILVNIARSFRQGMPPIQLYDLTRSCWKVAAPRCEKARYAFAVYQGLVKEVYEITAWLRSGTTFRHDFPAGIDCNDRQEFVGTVANENVRQKYLGNSVEHYLNPPSQNPIRYINC